MIKNLIFDMGGVVLNILVEPVQKAFAELGLPMPKELAALTSVPNSMPTAPGPFMKLITASNTGELQGDAFLTALKKGCREDVTLEQIHEAFNTMITLPKERLEKLQELGKKYRLLVLSNMGDLHWEYTLKMARDHGLPLENIFDKMYVSYQLGMVKPHADIFEHIIKDSGINPAETLYIDDFEENIEAGKRAGLQTLKIPSNSIEKYWDEI